MKSYPTAADAMRASLEAGNVPVLSDYVVRKNKLNLQQLALDLGCRIVVKGSRYYFHPGN